MTTWDPVQYERFKTYRDRPALDLMVQLPSDLGPKEIWDIGCGTGEHAALLALRHPDAEVYGLDSSAEMLASARARPGTVAWIEGDIAAFAPEVPPDLIFTNAALFPRLVSTLAPGGVFACQVPISFDTVWHREMRAVAADGPWAGKIADVRSVQPVAAPEAYYAWLSPLAEVDIWTTTYLHVLQGEDPVIEWMKGTGLRPYLQGLPDGAERETFLAAYRARIDAAFPKTADGSTLLPFPRLFIVARRR